MYSKYSGFSIPRNYGGSRFSTSSEPQTKTHRGEVGGATRHAHSPSFVSHNEAPIESYEASGEEYEEELALQDEPSEDTPEEMVLDVPSETFLEQDSPDDTIEVSFIEKLFRSLDKDQLLILALIILLMTDGDVKNDDIVFLLAILLLS